MAFRPTIAVVANKEIADIGYYRNWDTEDLFIEALGLAVIYGDLSTVSEVRERAFGKQKIGYIIEPEIIENTQENLRWLEDCSEFPIVVDLTRRAIYEGYCDSSDEFVDSKPDLEDVLWPGTITEKFYWDVLSRHKISLNKADMDCVRELFMKDDELRGHLSQDTAAKMREYFAAERSCESDDEGKVYQ